MGFINLINSFINKNKTDNSKYNYASSLNYNVPIFSQFGQNIYASDVVQQAISCIITELKKLQPKHIRDKNGITEEVTDREFNRLLEQPNEIMTTSDFIEKIAWNLFLNYNSFIYPMYEFYTDEKGQRKRKYTGLYPLQPSQVDFLQDTSERLFIKFSFNNGYNITLPYEDIIHIKYRYSVNDYMGGNAAGQPDNAALLKTLEINNTLLQNIAKSLEINYAINGIVKYPSMLDEEKMKKAIDQFNELIKNNKSGILPIDLKGEYIPITRNTALIDDKTLEFIDKKILRHFGVPIPILEGDYTSIQYASFYQKTLEPLVISFSQAFTKTLFTSTERSFGNKIVFYPEDLIFLNVDQKLNFVKEAGGRGALTNNQILKIFGLPPYEGGNTRYMSLNYVDVEIANQYQINKSKGGNLNEDNGGNQESE